MYLQIVDGKTVSRVYTFGQPKLTDASGAASPAFPAAKTVRVINCEDLIAVLPNPDMSSFWLARGYRHGGPVIFLDGMGRVWYASAPLEFDPLPLLGKTLFNDLFAGEPLRGHAIGTYLDRIRTATGDAAERDYREGAREVCGNVG